MILCSTLSSIKRFFDMPSPFASKKGNPLIESRNPDQFPGLKEKEPGSAHASIDTQSNV
jgi:hypothetical protein